MENLENLKTSVSSKFKSKILYLIGRIIGVGSHKEAHTIQNVINIFITFSLQIRNFSEAEIQCNLPEKAIA